MATMLTYARVDGGVVQEPLIQLPQGVLPNTIFGGGQIWVDVTAVNPPPTLGQVASNASGAWTFGAPAAPKNAPVIQVPASCSRFQFKMVLAGTPGTGSSTLLDNVSAWIATQPDATQVAWSDAPTITRGGAFMATLVAQFGWNSIKADGLFQAAVQIVGMV